MPSPPTFPTAFTAVCPQFLKDCVQYASDPRERDITLLGSLNCCSAPLPRCQLLLRQERPLLFPLLPCPRGKRSAAGKGVVAFILNLLDATQEYYDRQRRDQKKAFEKAQMAWEAEVHQALREHRSPDSDKKPEEPKAKYPEDLLHHQQEPSAGAARHQRRTRLPHVVHRNQHPHLLARTGLRQV